MLKSFLRLFSPFKSKKSFSSKEVKTVDVLVQNINANEVPDFVDNQEKIVRVIYSPKNISSEGKLRSSFYKTRGGEDEISVIRLDYCSEEFCKEHGKKFEDPNDKKSFYGLAMHFAEQIRNLGKNVDVVSSKQHFEVHADIKIGFIPEKGKELPSSFRMIVDELAESARIESDPDPLNSQWTGNRF